MKRSTHLVLVFSYYYAQILGILNFSYDTNTRRAYTNIYITIYAALVNVILFAVIPYFAMTLQIKSRPPGSAEVIYKLSILMTFIRIGGSLTTIIFNWTKRNDFIKLINKFLHFRYAFLEKYHKNEQFNKYIEKYIRAKCLTSLGSDLIVFTSSIQIIRDLFEISNIFLIMLLALMPTVLNVIMTHYYFALLNVNVLLIIIKEDLDLIIKTAKQYNIQTNELKSKLILKHITGLSDYVNILSHTVLQLQHFVANINRIYDIQGICCMLTVYVNNICVVYMTFMTSSPDKLWNQLNSFKGVFSIISLMIIYLDLKLFVYSLLNASHSVQELGELLKIKQSCHSYRDKSLERSVCKFLKLYSKTITLLNFLYS